MSTKTTGCRPLPGLDDDNDFHEVWWDSVAGGDSPKGRPQVQLHEVWQWMGDALLQGWQRPGVSRRAAAQEAYEEGWRYVRPIKLLDQTPRMDGEPPDLQDTL